MNALRTRIPSIHSSSRLAGSVAVGTSALLHGALAATLFAFYSPPLPEAPGAPIVVELVSTAPEQGTGQIPGIDTVTASGPAAEEEEKISAAEPAIPTPVSDTEPEDDVERVEAFVPESIPPESVLPESVLPESVLAEPTTEIAISDELPSMEAYDFPVTQTAFIPAPPRPVHEPPAQLAAILPPPRPNVDVTPDLPAASAEPVEIIEQTAPQSTAPVSRAEASPQVAARTTGEGSEAPSLSGGGGDPGGLFVGPGFRLGTARNPLPRYPMAARRRGLEGRVVLRVRVDAEGHPLSVRVARSSSHPILDIAAAAALKKWRFEPARRAGLTVDASVDVPITFRLRD